MNELKNDQQIQETNEEQSSFNFQTIYAAFILNWKWFLLSIFICMGIGLLYLRYSTPIYNTSAKLLIKDGDNENRSKGGALQALESMSNFGFISSNYGTENEQEILTSTTVAEQVIRDLKLYADYYVKENVKKRLVYKEQPISVEMDQLHLEKLDAPLELKIKRENNSYKIEGSYYIAENEITFTGPYEIEKTISNLPAVIRTQVGTLTLSKNGNYTLEDGETEYVHLLSPRLTSHEYVKKFSMELTSKTSSVFNLQFNDQDIARSVDYLNQLVICYNRQANKDKNEIAVRTEEFINDRLAKIDAELSSTDGAMESYKKRNRLMELQLDAMTTSTNTSTYEQKLNEANTQISLISSLINFANRPGNKHQVLPSNIGLQDEASTSLINEYNKIALERNRLLRTASEHSPVVIELTSQLDNMQASIHEALEQARKGLIIQRNSISAQLGLYDAQVTKAPEQERILTQIGRQQEVRSGLYLMLLQKREENSISLAATADKGKLIEKPQFNKKISPKGSIVMLIALVLGIAIPSGFIYIINFFRYRIEGHEDVASLTKLPIIADIVVASDTAKTRADIVVHENQNNQMEEIFRSMRTNIQFMLKPGQNVILFTSSTSGEGKTFTAANLAVSFALLGKKVILIGLDIRKPGLNKVFRLSHKEDGITRYLADPEHTDLLSLCQSTDVSSNLFVLPGGAVPPNPTELVARPSLDQAIALLKEHFDYVILDTAPIGIVTDTQLIARVADISVYVCRADYTHKSDYAFINDLQQNGKLSGLCTLINGINMNKRRNGYYYGYGKYGSYGRYGYGKKYGYGYGYGYGKK